MNLKSTCKFTHKATLLLLGVAFLLGGLNPAGDVRDIAANSRDAADGKPGSYVGLGGAVLGTIIPGVGDAGKAVIRGNKEAIAEGAEALLKTADEAATATVKTAEEQAAEQAAKAAAERAAREASYKTQAEALEAADGGHSLKRHGVEVTDAQLQARVTTGVAPDGVFSPTKSSTKFNSNEAWVETRKAALEQIQTVKGADLSKAPVKGADTEHEIVLEYNKAIDDGFVADAASKVKVADPTNPAKKGNAYASTQPVDGITRTYTKVVWDDKQGKWNVVQHYPVTEGWNNTTKTYDASAKPATTKVNLP